MFLFQRNEMTFWFTLNAKRIFRTIESLHKSAWASWVKNIDVSIKGICDYISGFCAHAILTRLFFEFFKGDSVDKTIVDGIILVMEISLDFLTNNDIILYSCPDNRDKLYGKKS